MRIDSDILFIRDTSIQGIYMRINGQAQGVDIFLINLFN